MYNFLVYTYDISCEFVCEREVDCVPFENLEDAFDYYIELNQQFEKENVLMANLLCTKGGNIIYGL